MATPYETDFFNWTRDQARRLRREARRGGRNDIDFENLAQEIEGLGVENRRELMSRIARVIEQLLRLEEPGSSEARRDAMARVQKQREAIRELLEESPSLVAVAERRLGSSYARARSRAVAATQDRTDATEPPESCPYRLDEIVDAGWWPREQKG